MRNGKDVDLDLIQKKGGDDTLGLFETKRPTSNTSMSSLKGFLLGQEEVLILSISGQVIEIRLFSLYWM